MIGTPSQYKKEKMFGKPPDSLPKGSYFLRTPEGSLYVKPYEDQYVIRDVFVTEDQRGKGFGRKMMSDILEFLLPKKKKIVLYVDPQNKIAKTLYLSLGFKFIKKSGHGDKLVIDPLHR
jgi:ribosomal protein S18 acetylase RimI-like enzyme